MFDCVLNQAPGASGGGDHDGQDVTHIVRPDWSCRSRVQSGADASLIWSRRVIWLECVGGNSVASGALKLDANLMAEYQNA